MQRVMWIVLVLFIVGCKTRVHEHFLASEIQSSTGKEVFNDPLGLYLYTPGDYKFETVPKKVDRRIRFTTGCFGRLVRDQENVLLHGETTVVPFYEFYITLNDQQMDSTSSVECEGVFRLDTIIQNMRIGVLAKMKDPKYRSNHRNDLVKSLSSIRTGEAYNEAVRNWKKGT